MSVYYRAGATGTGISTTLTTLTLTSTNLGGGALDRNPDDSTNPITLGVNELTVGENTWCLFFVQVDANWSSTNPSAGDYAQFYLDEDTGGGYSAIASARMYHEKGDDTGTIALAHKVSSGTTYRIRANTTGPTVNFQNGKFSIWRDGNVGTTTAPADAQYVTLATDGDLDNERVLTAGSGISLTDGGAGSTATLAVDINSLSADASPDGAADYVMTRDATDGSLKKVLLDDLPSGGGGGGAPTDAQYVTLATDSSLSDERVLTAGEGVTYSDGGAGGNATLNLNAPGLTAYTSPSSIDYLIIYDDTAKAHKRITLANFLRLRDAAMVAGNAISAAGGSPMLGVAFGYHMTTMSESDFAGTPIADAITAIQHFRTNGDWRNLRSIDDDAVLRALQALNIFTNWTGATT